MKSPRTTRLVAIVGGSGAGKTWLADQLQKDIGNWPICCGPLNTPKETYEHYANGHAVG